MLEVSTFLFLFFTFCLVILACWPVCSPRHLPLWGPSPCHLQHLTCLSPTTWPPLGAAQHRASCAAWQLGAWVVGVCPTPPMAATLRQALAGDPLWLLDCGVGALATHALAPDADGWVQQLHYSLEWYRRGMDSVTELDNLWKLDSKGTELGSPDEASRAAGGVLRGHAPRQLHGEGGPRGTPPVPPAGRLCRLGPGAAERGAAGAQVVGFGSLGPPHHLLPARHG